MAAGALGAGCYVRHVRSWESEKQMFVQGQQICVRGTLIRKEQKNESWQLTLVPTGYTNQVIVSTEDGGYPLDCVLLVKGTVREYHTPRNEGQFNEENYDKCRQILCRIDGSNITCIRVPSGIHRWRECLFLLREKLCQVYKAGLPAQLAGIMSVMTVGEKSLLDADVRTSFQRVGISHILAISGMHVSMIGMGIYAMLRKCRRSYIGSAVVTAGVLVCYGTMIGMGVSASRAIGMFVLYLLAQCIGRRYDTSAALAVMAMGLLADEPFRLFDVSYQFSFLAVFAVVTTQAVLPERSGQGRNYAVAYPMLSSLLLQLFTIPLAAYYYYEVPVYALFLNLLLLPYLGVALGCGLLGGCVGLWMLPLGRWLLAPCRVVLSVYVWTSHLVERLPYATVICGRPSAAKLCIYYGLLTLLLLFLWWEKQRVQRSVYRSGIVCLAGAAILFVVLCHVSKGGFEIDYLDVGQGDGSLLRTEEGAVCFVDGGSSDVTGVGTYRILPFLKSKGIRQVDYWILSHLDDDHLSGFYEVLEAGYEVRAVVVSELLPEDEAKSKLIETLEQYKVPMLSVSGGDILQLHNTCGGDESADGGVCIRFLSPDETTPVSDCNGASLVCLYEDASVHALWTGDVGVQQETWLLERGLLSQIDLYKAAHHGSKYSNSQEYLQTLSPKLSVISCGERNRYGHPGAEAVENMKASGSRVLCTMECGQIKIRRGREGLVYSLFVEE